VIPLNFLDAKKFDAKKFDASSYCLHDTKSENWRQRTRFWCQDWGFVNFSTQFWCQWHH
jgi:hypothetical protein